MHFAASALGLHCLHNIPKRISGPGCSNLTTSVVNVSVKFFQTLISEIRQYFLLQKLLSFFNKKYLRT